MTLDVNIQTLENFTGLSLPAYETEQAAGMDLCAAIDKDHTLTPGHRGLIKTGLAVALPTGYEMQIRPRSGLAYKNGVTVLNAPGTIDSDYRGEIGVVLINHGKEPFTITRGMRIAQAVIAKHERVQLTVTDNLDQTARGQGGFGSTGTGDKAA